MDGLFPTNLRYVNNEGTHCVWPLWAHDQHADCGLALRGDGVRRAATAAGCSQVVRALFVDDQKRWYTVVAVFNMPDRTDAQDLAELLEGHADALALLHALPPDPLAGLTDSASRSVRARYDGHYAVVAVAGFVDGRTTRYVDREKTSGKRADIEISQALFVGLYTTFDQLSSRGNDVGS
jgi:hypothetical protein